jgi:LysR family transcriptional regulator, glycine cleavage system transcriptional activator
MPRRLPSLNGLLAFEAAARHVSFTRAGQELHVTPSAVSHQVRALEAELGLRLFVRRPRALGLTPAGVRAAAVAGQAFAALERGLRRLPSRAPRTLTVSVLPSFAAGWLVSRLHRFHARHPGVDLRLHATQELADLQAGEADLAIRYGRGPYPGLHSERLLGEEAFPVCAPGLARRLRRPGDLKGLPLLHDEARGAHGGWPAWLEAAGVRGVASSRGARFSDARLLLQAAAAGQGVALSRSLPAHDELLAGRLVRPFAPALRCRYHYALVTTPEASTRPLVRAFRAFLRREARAYPLERAGEPRSLG